jgi:hypothetical protein
MDWRISLVSLTKCRSDRAVAGAEMTWQRPYSIKRLLRMIRGHDWSARTDFDDWEDDGGPYIARAHRRAMDVLTQRREQRDAKYEPLRDEVFGSFQIDNKLELGRLLDGQIGGLCILRIRPTQAPT